MEIIRGVYLGDRFDASDAFLLQEQKISAVLNCATEIPNYFDKNSVVDREIDFEDEIAYKKFAIRDTETQIILTLFNDSYDFIEEMLRAGRKILIHCQRGKSRSASFVLAFLMRYQSMNCVDAKNFIDKKVAEHGKTISINNGFLNQLIEYNYNLYPQEKVLNIGDFTKRGEAKMYRSQMGESSSNLGDIEIDDDAEIEASSGVSDEEYEKDEDGDAVMKDDSDIEREIVKKRKKKRKPKKKKKKKRKKKRKKKKKKKQDSVRNYYYYTRKPQEGEWSVPEKKKFLKMLKKMPNPEQWGEFSRSINTRTGRQCAAFYQKLILDGEIDDSRYTVTTDLSGKRVIHVMKNVLDTTLNGGGYWKTPRERVRKSFKNIFRQEDDYTFSRSPSKSDDERERKKRSRRRKRTGGGGKKTKKKRTSPQKIQDYDDDSSSFGGDSNTPKMNGNNGRIKKGYFSPSMKSFIEDDQFTFGRSPVEKQTSPNRQLNFISMEKMDDSSFRTPKPPQQRDQRKEKQRQEPRESIPRADFSFTSIPKSNEQQKLPYFTKMDGLHDVGFPHVPLPPKEKKKVSFGNLGNDNVGEKYSFTRTPRPNEKENIVRHPIYSRQDNFLKLKTPGFTVYEDTTPDKISQQSAGKATPMRESSGKENQGSRNVPIVVEKIENNRQVLLSDRKKKNVAGLDGNYWSRFDETKTSKRKSRNSRRFMALDSLGLVLPNDGSSNKEETKKRKRGGDNSLNNENKRRKLNKSEFYSID